ncbi:hypothetical protein [Maridesulfovibrio sp.]|uniref:hypothetical protein n=1 Tax=Maridesulfovibrio sp. TaxID=2795000 RepID=UPI0029F57A5A|nr:hypothetical protein [Maridesulfovibrio sp.]
MSKDSELYCIFENMLPEVIESQEYVTVYRNRPLGLNKIEQVKDSTQVTMNNIINWGREYNEESKEWKNSMMTSTISFDLPMGKNFDDVFYKVEDADGGYSLWMESQENLYRPLIEGGHF